MSLRREQEEPTRGAEQEPPGPQAPTASPAFAGLQALQQGHGNAYVSRLVSQVLARHPAGDQAARDAFVRRGVMPSAAGLDMTSTTGIGGFNAKYDPRSQALTITLRVGIAFPDALTVDPATGNVTPANADFAASARSVRARFPNVADRVNEVQTNWNWSGDQKTTWRERYEAEAEGAWGQRHYFQSDCWEDLYANVRVDLDVHDGHRDNDHCKATVFKVPEGSSAGGGAVVNSSGTATGSTGTFTSADLEGTSDYLNYSLRFPRASANLYQAVATSEEATGDRGNVHLDKIIVDFQRGTPTGGAPITVTGRSSTSGDPERNRSLAERRANAVADYLRTRGRRIAASRVNVVVAGPEGATEDESFQRVDIQIGDGRRQRTMVHETGHMFGLDDEYASPPGGIAPGAGTPGLIGTPTGHNALAGAMGGGVTGAVYENNDSVMSVGNVVRPQHYATFLEALHQVATPERFHYGGQGTAPLVNPDAVGPHVPQRDPNTATATA